MKLTGRTAIVTAAAGAGIGQATAWALAREGANVVVSDGHATRPFSVAEEIRGSTGVGTLGIRCDVSQRQDVDNMVEQAMNSFGRVDILVNNAGIDFAQPVVDMSDETWERIMNVNLRGTFYCTRAVLPAMIRQGYGRIANLSSVAAWTRAIDSAAYSAAKAGVAAFTKAVAREVAQHNILVNAVAPGIAYNPFLEKIAPRETMEELLKEIPIGRFGTPEDMARVILFLVSEEASYITGECICVTGGWFAH